MGVAPTSGAVAFVDGHWACRQHADKPPANGWN
jgi:hypothetical protein